MAIKLTLRKTERILFCGSKWWGDPDMPANMEYPTVTASEDGETFDYPLTFICQIRMEDIRHLDHLSELPDDGMLWFFADLDYFLGDDEARCEGMGEWSADSFRVIYSCKCTTLCTHELYWESGEPAVLPAESVTFEETEETEYCHKLLGQPAMTEGWENENEGMLSLLQIEEEDRWHLRFFDCGMVNFMIPYEAMQQQDFSKVSVCLHSL